MLVIGPPTCALWYPAPPGACRHIEGVHPDVVGAALVDECRRRRKMEAAEAVEVNEGEEVAAEVVAAELATGITAAAAAAAAAVVAVESARVGSSRRPRKWRSSQSSRLESARVGGGGRNGSSACPPNTAFHTSSSSAAYPGPRGTAAHPAARSAAERTTAHSPSQRTPLWEILVPQSQAVLPEPGVAGVVVLQPECTANGVLALQLFFIFTAPRASQSQSY